jgi:translation initiation factor IF-2
LPIRIYSLAKELQIDNKKLVDICTRAGITGKGSALASLTDEEVVRLKAFMARGSAGGRGDGGAAARAAGGGAAGAGRSIRRDDYIPPGGTAGSKVPVLPPVKHDKPPRLPEVRKKPEETAPPVHPAVDVPPAPVAPAVPAVAATVQVAPPPVAPPPVAIPVAPPPAAPLAAVEASTAPASLLSAPADHGYMVPAPPAAGPASPLSPPASAEPGAPTMPPRTAVPMSRPLEMLLGKSKQGSKPGERPGGEKKPGERKPAERSAPTMHLAPMPSPSKTPAKHKPKEPAPQKPDIKLPPDAIRASKAGSRPLSEQLRKHEEKKKRDDLAAKKGPARAGEAGTGAVPPAELGGKERPRRAPAKPAKAPGWRRWAAASSGRQSASARPRRNAAAATTKRRPAAAPRGGPTSSVAAPIPPRPAKEKSSWSCPAPSAPSRKPPEFPKQRSSASSWPWGS